MEKKTHEAREAIRNLFQKTKIKEIMITPVHTVLSHEELSRAQAIFSQEGVSHLPVLNFDQKVVGLISQKYLYKTQSPRKMTDDPIEPAPDVLLDKDSFYLKESLDSYILFNVMQKNPMTLGPEAPVAEAVMAMASKRIGCIPIVNPDQRICGILTNQEIVDFTAKMLRE